MGFLVSILLSSLGPLGGYKTYIGLGLAVLDTALRYWDANHPALGLVAALITGLGLGDKMGKERANPTPK